MIETSTVAVEVPPGMRERKKRERRQAIAQVALELFAKHGYESVTIRDIAQAADFNYFPTKESLVYNQESDREDALVGAVRHRLPGVSVVAAFREKALELLIDGFVAQPKLDWVRVATRTPSLQQYRREMYHRQAVTLAAALRETDQNLSGLAATAIARALMDVASATTEELGRRLLKGVSRRKLREQLRVEMSEAFDLLEGGLASIGSSEETG
jgi:AcrR family transcriptional regulator